MSFKKSQINVGILLKRSILFKYFSNLQYVVCYILLYDPGHSMYEEVQSIPQSFR